MNRSFPAKVQRSLGSITEESLFIYLCNSDQFLCCAAVTIGVGPPLAY
jgi:hypothetical protein